MSEVFCIDGATVYVCGTIDMGKAMAVANNRKQECSISISLRSRIAQLEAQLAAERERVKARDVYIKKTTRWLHDEAVLEGLFDESSDAIRRADEAAAKLAGEEPR